ncbi:MAG: sugar phosphate isomerase/epimerase family protein [Terriglobia bacterium]|jgi:L-ribulose-5-phosphate 3-epimerase
MAWSLTRRSLLSLAALLGSGLRLSFAGGKQVPNSSAPKLGVITDELSEEFEKALEFISEHSLGYCEVRELWNKNVTRLSQEELERAKQSIEQHHLKVSEIASPLFKYHLPGMPSPRPNWGDTFKAADLTDKDTESLLEQVFRLAPFFGTSKVRVFSYWRVEDPEKAYPLVRDRLAKAAAMAAQHNITLLLENETDCNVGTGKELGRMVRDINSPNLLAMWDPCNALGLGETPYPDGYREVRGLFRHMHVKDMRKDPAAGKFRYVPVGKGEIDYRGQFKALRDDGYEGTMSIETSYVRPDKDKLEATRECLEGLLSVWKSANA